jgi:hypothetical protein
MVGRLQALANCRGQWTDDVAALSPGLLAYYIRDFGDMVSHRGWRRHGAGCPAGFHGFFGIPF